MSRNNITNPLSHIPPPAPYQQANGQYEEDTGYRYYYYTILNIKCRDLYINNVSNLFRTMTKEDAAIIQERRMSQQTQSKI